MKKIIVFLCVLCTFFALGGCTQSTTKSTRNVNAVSLNEKQQMVADGIWDARTLWSGCSELAIYKHNGKYYLAANKLVSERNVPDLFDGKGTVGTYKRYAYEITEDGKVLDDLTLSDAGVTSVGQRLGAVYFYEGDTAEIKKALISQLVAKVGF